MEKQAFEVKITILDLWRIFVSKFFIILLGALLVGGATFAYSYYTYEPVYQSTSRLYILPQFQEIEATPGVYSQTLTAALNTVNDSKLIIQSPSTMQNVIDELDLGISTAQLSENVTVTNSDDSRIIKIVARSNDQALAQKIANTVASQGIARINEVTGIEQANLMDAGRLPASPINSAFSFKIVVFAAAAAVLIYAIYVIIFLNNDRITTAEEASNYLSLTVLGIIPNEDEIQNNKKYKGYGAYKSKKYAKTYEHKNKEDVQEQEETKSGSKIEVIIK